MSNKTSKDENSITYCSSNGPMTVPGNDYNFWEMKPKVFVKVTSQMDKHIMYINKNYIMMLEKLANGSRIWVSGGDHGNVRIVNESVEELLEQMGVE